MEEAMNIKIGGREIPLYYSTYETIAIQREIGCTAFQLKDVVFGLKLIDEDGEAKLDNLRMEVANDPDRMEKLAKLIKILGNAGLEEAGQEADLTEKWILRNIKPALITVYAVTVMALISEGNTMEKKSERKGDVDEILEEEQAKKPPRS